MKRAATLMELLILLVIIAILAAIIVGVCKGDISVGDTVRYNGRTYTVTAIVGYRGTPHRSTTMLESCILSIASEDGRCLTVSESLVSKDAR